MPDRLQERFQERRGVRDAEALEALAPGLRESLEAVDRLVPDLAASHARYVAEAETTPVMAASLELSRFLIAWCSTVQPLRIVDLGSGFTSYALRRWAETEGAGSKELLSVDDEVEWLGRSREFSARSGLDSEGFLTWGEFEGLAGARAGFDLVVNDFSSVRRRAELTDRVFGLVRRGGAVLCDDIQKARLWRAARQAARRQHFDGYSLRTYTLDRIGRFAWIGLKSSALPGRAPARA